MDGVNLTPSSSPLWQRGEATTIPQNVLGGVRYFITINLFSDRSEQMNGVEGNNSYWLAYESGKQLSEMRKVKWESHTYLNDNNEQVTGFIWVTEIDGVLKRWNKVTFKDLL